VIVGSGMIAGALKKLTGWEKDIIFSSGVSNSNEQSIYQFQKELKLIQGYLKQVPSNSSFVYFSTTSIFDASKSKNPYILHKLSIEKLLQESGVNYLIVRLPNLVGISTNPHTLTNFFADCIRNGRLIDLKSDAIRHLIDVDDLTTILNDIKTKHGKEKIVVNVETDHPLSAEQILNYLEITLGKKAKIKVDPQNKNGTLANVIQHVGAINFLWKTGENYHKELFRKYYSD
jgi:nucleoside-diphosphate-sugar epimerase